MRKKEFLIKTRQGVYRALIWLDKGDKVYLVKVPSLPGVATFGATLSQAKEMAKEAIELHCGCEIDEGNIIVDDTGRAIGKIPKSRVIPIHTR